jgi:tetratricopeptide (TPR) repeat protein
MKNILRIVLILWLSIIVLQAQDRADFLISTGVSIPTGPTISEINSSPYTPGFKIDGRGLFPLGNLPLSLHGQFGLNMSPLQGANAGGTALNLISLQAGPAYTLQLGDSLQVIAALQGGGFLGMIEGAVGGNGVVSARTDVNLAISSNLTLGLGADYSYYLSTPTPTMDHTWSGLGAGINLKFALNGGERKSRLEIQEIIIFPVYPVLYGYYNDNKLGEITIKNTEPADIKNIAVSLYIPKYMSGPQTFQSGQGLKKGEVKTFDIFGLLDSSILEETEGALVQAEVTVSYDLRKDNISLASGSQADILYRNALEWTDDRRAASFVTAKEPGIMEFAKNTTSSVKEEINSELDPSLVNGMIIFEALSLYGLNYQIDPNSSYKDLAGQEGALDYLQFPIETLNYKAGDCDDLSVLFTAILESLAVETAFITVPGHIYSAIALEMSPDEAQKTFASTNAIIYKEGKAWIPIETTMLDGSNFMDAWRMGSKQWEDAAINDEAKLYPIQDAWQLYPPVALNAYRDKNLSLPTQNLLKKSYSTMISQLIDQETKTQVAYLEKAIRESRGERRYRMINSLAVLKARYGLFDEAANLLKSITTNDTAYSPGATNLANIYYRQNDLEQASAYYTKALNWDPDQPKAVLGIMLVEQAKGNNLGVQNAYGELAKLSPSLAEKYSYLATGQSDVKRASGAGQKEKVLWDED